MSSVKQRLLEAIEQTPEPLLEQTLVFLEFLTTREKMAIAQTITPKLQASLHSTRITPKTNLIQAS
jgi:hypothetical protein